MRTVLTIITLTLLQALFFGRIHLFDVATPLVCTYFVLNTQRGTSKILLMVQSFILGLAIDIFNNTPGLAATTLTLMACLQPYVLEIFLGREDEKDFLPTLHEMGFMRYATYAFFLLFVYTLVYFTLYILPGADELIHWALSIVSSLLLTLAIIIAIEVARKRK